MLESRPGPVEGTGMHEGTGMQGEGRIPGQEQTKSSEEMLSLDHSDMDTHTDTQAHRRAQGQRSESEAEKGELALARGWPGSTLDQLTTHTLLRLVKLRKASSSSGHRLRTSWLGCEIERERRAVRQDDDDDDDEIQAGPLATFGEKTCATERERERSVA